MFKFSTLATPLACTDWPSIGNNISVDVLIAN